MSADDVLLRRLEELDRKVRILESHRHVPGWFVVLVCGFLGGWLGRFVTELPQARAQADGAMDIVAKSIKIVDDQGKPAIEFANGKFGGVGRIFNAEGKAIVTIDGDIDGGFVKIAGHEGAERAFLGVGENKSSGLLYFRSADAKSMPVYLGVGAHGGYLNLGNLAANKRTVWLGANDENEGVVHIHDNRGNMRCFLGSNPQGGMINIYGSKKGKSHVFLGTGSLDLGGLLLLRDDDGRVRGEMGQGRNGGYFILNGNKDGRPHFNIDTYDDQRGSFLQIQDNSGKARVELGIDTAGAGYVDTFEKK